MKDPMLRNFHSQFRFWLIEYFILLNLRPFFFSFFSRNRFWEEWRPPSSEEISEESGCAATAVAPILFSLTLQPIVYCTCVCPLLLFSNTPGNLDNTFPNPSLRRRSGTKHAKGGLDEREKQRGGVDDDEYLPAYMLSDWSLERAGRGKRTIDTLACELR